MIYFELFYTFFLIGLLTFGGGYAMIPMIRDQVVSRGWISETTLTDFIAISEVTPGPFAVNISTFIGNNTAGILGAIIATLAVILPSTIIIVIIALVMNKFLKNKYVQGGLNGIKPIVLSLILSTTIVMFFKIIFNTGNIFLGEFDFDLKSFGLLLILSIYLIAYKKVKKKSLGAIPLLGLSALLGLIIFI